jgi:hypothetical protein
MLQGHIQFGHCTHIVIAAEVTCACKPFTTFTLSSLKAAMAQACAHAGGAAGVPIEAIQVIDPQVFESLFMPPNFVLYVVNDEHRAAPRHPSEDCDKSWQQSLDAHRPSRC